MINVDFDKSVTHTFTFDEDQIRDILIEALRINGLDIPDDPSITAGGDSSETFSNFNVTLIFTQEELDDYKKDLYSADDCCAGCDSDDTTFDGQKNPL